MKQCLMIVRSASSYLIVSLYDFYQVGYAGGFTPNPTYQEVCSGQTGHTEVVRVVFDPSKVAYSDLLKVSLVFLSWGGEAKYCDCTISKTRPSTVSPSVQYMLKQDHQQFRQVYSIC